MHSHQSFQSPQLLFKNTLGEGFKEEDGTDTSVSNEVKTLKRGEKRQKWNWIIHLKASGLQGNKLSLD